MPKFLSLELQIGPSIYSMSPLGIKSKLVLQRLMETLPGLAPVLNSSCISLPANLLKFQPCQSIISYLRAFAHVAAPTWNTPLRFFSTQMPSLTTLSKVASSPCSLLHTLWGFFFFSKHSSQLLSIFFYFLCFYSMSDSPAKLHAIKGLGHICLIRSYIPRV